MIEEEIQVGTVVGSLKAYDADSDANAIVGFLIIGIHRLKKFLINFISCFFFFLTQE